MQVEKFLEIIGASFYAGVPDSQLKALCDCLLSRYGIDYIHHQIGANEGNCVGMAAGYHLATGKLPLVYLQNSGLGNIINPVASLLHPDIYGIPCVFVIGWRGEPGVKDEPQHRFQGRITEALLDDMEISYAIISSDTTVGEAAANMEKFRGLLKEGRQVAFLVRKGALAYQGKECSVMMDKVLSRESIIGCILAAAGTDRIVCTTGKASRELYELREALTAEHNHDFLTIGSMGHASSIAFALAEHCRPQRIWCLDGDGAALMHLGAMAAIGAASPENLVHVVLNNKAHDSVGGQPTAAVQADFCKIAEGCGYPLIFRAENKQELLACLTKIRKSHQLTFLEVSTAVGSRKNLGRPKRSSMENKNAFMKALKQG